MQSNSPKMFLISSRLWFWWWLWYGTECYAMLCYRKCICYYECARNITNICERVRKCNLTTIYRVWLSVLLLAVFNYFIINYFIICIYSHFMSVKSEVHWIGVCWIESLLYLNSTVFYIWNEWPVLKYFEHIVYPQASLQCYIENKTQINLWRSHASMK